MSIIVSPPEHAYPNNDDHFPQVTPRPVRTPATHTTPDIEPFGWMRDGECSSPTYSELPHALQVRACGRCAVSELCADFSASIEVDGVTPKPVQE